MEVVVAHKGKHSYRCRVRGFEAHSALTPKGVNAVEIACEIVAYLRGMAKRFRENGRFDRDYDVPLHDRSRRHDQGRHGAQHRAARLRVPVRVPASAVRRSRATAPRGEGLRRALPARDARGGGGHGHHVRGALRVARLRYGRRQRDRRARPLLQPRHRRQQGVLRCRSVALPQRGHSRHPVRPGPHRAGAPAQRMGDAGSGGAVRERSCAGSSTR